MSAPYPGLDTVNATNDVTQILVYANTLTDGWLGIGILASFFLVILLGSMFAQMRFSGRGRFDVSFGAASFSTFGMAVLMSLEDGLIAPSVVVITIALSIVGAFWLFFSEPNPY